MNPQENLIPKDNFFFQMMTFFEDQYSQTLQKMIADDEVMATISRFRDTLLELKGYFEKQLSESFRQLNLPTKEMIGLVAEKADILEARSLEIDWKLDQILNEPSESLPEKKTVKASVSTQKKTSPASSGKRKKDKI